MDTLPHEIMAMMTKFLDYRSICELYRSNRTWCKILSKDETWEMLFNAHFLHGTKFRGKTAKESYYICFHAKVGDIWNKCYFCVKPARVKVCLDCLDKIWEDSLEHYRTNDIVDMMILSGCEENTGEGYGPFSRDCKSDALTFKYASPEHKQQKCTTDGEFVIDLLENVIKCRDEPLFSSNIVRLENISFWFYVEVEKTRIQKDLQYLPATSYAVVLRPS